MTFVSQLSKNNKSKRQGVNKMYRSGTYVVAYDDKTGYHRGGVFETEREARDFGNRLWRNPAVSSVKICRCQFYKKRRNCVTIAKAER